MSCLLLKHLVFLAFCMSVEVGDEDEERSS